MVSIGSALIDADEGGAIQSEDGAVIFTVPAGAITEDIEFSITKVEESDWPDGATPLTEMYEILPSGTTFETPALLEWNLSGVDLESDGGRAFALGLVYDESDALEVLDTLNVGNEGEAVLAVSEVTHLSRFVIRGLNMVLSGEQEGGRREVGVPWTENPTVSFGDPSDQDLPLDPSAYTFRYAGQGVGSVFAQDEIVELPISVGSIEQLNVEFQCEKSGLGKAGFVTAVLKEGGGVAGGIMVADWALQSGVNLAEIDCVQGVGGDGDGDGDVTGDGDGDGDDQDPDQAMCDDDYVCSDLHDDCKNTSAGTHEECPASLKFVDIDEVAIACVEGGVAIVTKYLEPLPLMPDDRIEIDYEFQDVGGFFSAGLNIIYEGGDSIIVNGSFITLGEDDIVERTDEGWLRIFLTNATLAAAAVDLHEVSASSFFWNDGDERHDTTGFIPFRSCP